MQNPVMEPAAHAADELPPLPFLPLREVVGAPAVVFVGLLAGGTRPLVLDASAVREVEPAAARMLLSLLEAKRDAGVEARIQGASAALRRRFHAHDLAPFFADAAPAGESLFVCPTATTSASAPAPAKDAEEPGAALPVPPRPCVGRPAAVRQGATRFPRMK
jgi:hypothetical protein